MPEESR